jgi:hypothetical protein
MENKQKLIEDKDNNLLCVLVMLGYITGDTVGELDPHYTCTHWHCTCENTVPEGTGKIHRS